MPAVESTIVLLARPTTLVGAHTFCTMPLDVSGFGSVQLQIWRGPILGGGATTFALYFEESLDCQTWALGPATPVGYDPANATTGGDPSFVKPQFFAYAFRLRWFRLRVVTGGTAPIVTCYAEGLLRDGGGGGAWEGAPRPVISPPPRLRNIDTERRAEVAGRAAGGAPWDPANQNPLSSFHQIR